MPTRMTLQLVDRSITRPNGVIEDVLIQIKQLVFPADFVVMDVEEDPEIPIILGHLFMSTTSCIVDIGKGKLELGVENQKVSFDLFEAVKHPHDQKTCFDLDMVKQEIESTAVAMVLHSLLERALVNHVECLTKEEELEVQTCIQELNGSRENFEKHNAFEELENSGQVEKPKVELKTLPAHLKYVFLEDKESEPIIISSSLRQEEENQLVQILKKHKAAIGWHIYDLKGISPSYCMHKINMEADFKPIRQPQRRLNPIMKEEVCKEVLKLLEVGLIYPISDSEWVSPIQVVPKKGGMMVIKNDKDELISTRTITGWRMCIDYRKLNDATQKDHYPLPFMDQMLERLAGQSYYCFLDGYFDYNQIVVDPKDQEKTTFTCPFGVFANRRMPFSLCNAPATFQRCMMEIFSDMVEKYIEVIMDDFSVFGSSFDGCLTNLEKVLQRCEESNLVLNWEKCHFTVQEGIVLGHKISVRGIKVDKAKIDVIEKLPPPMNVK